MIKPLLRRFLVVPKESPAGPKWYWVCYGEYRTTTAKKPCNALRKYLKQVGNKELLRRPK